MTIKRLNCIEVYINRCLRRIIQSVNHIIFPTNSAKQDTFYHEVAKHEYCWICYTLRKPIFISRIELPRHKKVRSSYKYLEGNNAQRKVKIFLHIRINS